MAARAKVSLLVLIMSLVSYMVGTTESSITPTEFIRSSCEATSYPALCVQCLTGYASAIGQSDQQLAITAISVSISRTQLSASFVNTMSKSRGIKQREYRAMQDCIENMADSLDRLSKSVTELGNIGHAVGEDFRWHMSNVQTWVSAALTDDDSCLDGFTDLFMNENVKAAIKDKVVNVAQVTSNALALVNRFASNHRTAETP
ncbi:21 kDa protein [Cicer arietinum]|uniref:21 kDa protein-like n=1 Tax=Cicer arietinum TaxID=3827 RepID=A0A1S2YXT8_CICAR|nr:21 kDa protein-like [Cicer arietinum]